MKDPGHLTADDIYKYVKCPSWLYWDIFGDPKEKDEISEMMRLLKEQGVMHEKEVVEGLGEFEELPDEGDPRTLAEETLRMMESGAERIYQGTLMHDDWAGRPDLLVRVPGRSRFGEWMYEPADIRSTRHLNDVHRYQLTFYALLLERAQGVMPARGWIINTERMRLEYDIREKYAEFFEVLNAVIGVRSGEKPPPYLTASCKESPWFEALKREVAETDDLSQIYKLWRKEYRRLRDAGYHTVSEVAGADVEELDQAVIGIGRPRLERIRLQAKALKTGEAIRIGEADLPDEGPELHFDIEGDPFEQVDYLFGLLIREDGEERYVYFMAETPEQEGEAWTAFCDFIEGYAGAPIYHYGWYEIDVIRKLSAKYGISREADAALAFERMIDLNRLIQQTVVFPLYFYSLKDICAYLGFRWRAEDASGANSVMWYHDWHEKGDRALRQKILDYNEDDVRATAFLKDWLVSGK